MSLLGWFLVILLTFLAAMLGVGWLMERGNAALERIKLLDQLDQATANVQLPRTGWLDYQADPCGAGAQDPAFELREPDPMALAAAAFELGQQRASQDEISRTVDEIMLEVELNPRWKYR